MAFFKSLIKEHGKEFFEPIGKTLQSAGIKNFNPMNPAHAWAAQPTRSCPTPGVDRPAACRLAARRAVTGTPQRLAPPRRASPSATAP